MIPNFWKCKYLKYTSILFEYWFFLVLCNHDCIFDCVYVSETVWTRDGNPKVRTTPQTSACCDPNVVKGVCFSPERGHCNPSCRWKEVLLAAPHALLSVAIQLGPSPQGQPQLAAKSLLNRPICMEPPADGVLAFVWLSTQADSLSPGRNTWRPDKLAPVRAYRGLAEGRQIYT